MQAWDGPATSTYDDHSAWDITRDFANLALRDPRLSSSVPAGLADEPPAHHQSTSSLRSDLGLLPGYGAYNADLNVADVKGSSRQPNGPFSPGVGTSSGLNSAASGGAFDLLSSRSPVSSTAPPVSSASGPVASQSLELHGLRLTEGDGGQWAPNGAANNFGGHRSTSNPGDGSSGW